MPRDTSFAHLIERDLHPDLWRLIVASGKIGAAQGQPLYIVGGRVRDLVLGLADGDLDLVVEGDAVALARALASEHGGEVVSHPRFGTAKYQLGELAVDFATVRSEVYSRPGALPLVRPGSIDTDLARRDFTINSRAVRLSPPGFGALLDPHNGQGDLQARLIRTLHPRSFIDDATRIMRAIRYEQRLGFRLEETTLEYLLRDLPYLETVGVDRLRHELELFLREERPELALIRADGLGVLKGLHPSLKANDSIVGAFTDARSSAAGADPMVHLAVLLYGMESEEATGFVEQYRFTKGEVKVIEDLGKVKALAGPLGASEVAPSRVYGLLQGLAPEALRAFQLLCEPGPARDRVSLYLDELRNVRPCLDGNQLKSLGVAPGPTIGHILKELLNARLDGVVKTRAEEVSLVERWLKEEGQA